jgi:hypothetical protein
MSASNLDRLIRGWLHKTEPTGHFARCLVKERMRLNRAFAIRYSIYDVVGDHIFSKAFAKYHPVKKK